MNNPSDNQGADPAKPADEPAPEYLPLPVFICKPGLMEHRRFDWARRLGARVARFFRGTRRLKSE